MSSIIDCNVQPVAAGSVGRGGPAEVLPGALERWVAKVLHAARNNFTAWRRYRRTLHELGKLDDWALRDIGLTRADLPKGASAGDLRGIAETLLASRPLRRRQEFPVLQDRHWDGRRR